MGMLRILMGRAMCCAALGLLVCGCTVINAFDDPGVVGEWRSQNRVDGKRNELTVELNGDGDAKMFLFIDGARHRELFDIDWTQRGPEKFRLVMSCQQSQYRPGQCDGFRMVCRDVAVGDDSMSCTADGFYSTYPRDLLRWELK